MEEEVRNFMNYVSSYPELPGYCLIGRRTGRLFKDTTGQIKSKGRNRSVTDQLHDQRKKLYLVHFNMQLWSLAKLPVTKRSSVSNSRRRSESLRNACGHRRC